MTDRDLWQHLEAEFARVLGEVPKPKGPEPEKAKEARALARQAAQADASVGRLPQR